MTKSLSLALYLATRKRGKPLMDMDDFPDRPNGPLVWLHTGHDTQARAVLELAKRLRSEREDLTFLLTPDPENVANPVDYIASQPVPDETQKAISAFLDHWRPDLAIWTEPDLRPALITEISQRLIPLILADAGTAAPVPSSRRWWPGLSGKLLSRFDHIITGDATTASHYQRLGARSEAIEITGFLEEGSPALGYNEGDRNALAHLLGGRPVWLAMAVTDAERDAVIAAHRQAQRRAHRLLLILVPDDPAKGTDWARALIEDGHSISLRSTGEEPAATTQIYVADTPDEAGLWYRLAAIAFLGQSFDTGVGTNPFEAAALGSAILHGPNVRNYRTAYDRLAAAGAARLVSNADTLGDMVEALLSPDIAASMAHQAWRVCSSGAEVTDRLIDLTLTGLDAREPA